MDISTFRQIADETAAIAAQWPSDLIEKYRFLGLSTTGSHSTHFVSEKLYDKIHKAFRPGNIRITDQCRLLMGELIYDQILDNRPIEPYCELLAIVKDATQSNETVGSATEEEWYKAIESAHLSLQQMSLNAAENLTRTYTTYYAVGWAAKRLRTLDYFVDRNGSVISLSGDVETKLVAHLESLVHEFGGLYVTTQIGNILRNVYDTKQERYHLVVPQKLAIDARQPLLPLGYLFQLAVKHYQGGKPCGINNPQKFQFLLALVRDYTTILEVQDFSIFPQFPFKPDKLIEAVRKKALADSIYKIPQVRASDIPQILLGLIDYTILDDPFEKGWSIRQAIEVIDVVLNEISTPGLTRVFSRDVRKRCRSISGDIVNIILSEVLSHPHKGANQSFSRPTDGSNSLQKDQYGYATGPDFSRLPLLRYTDQSYLLLDRSICSGAFIEAIFIQLREKYQNIDRDYLGKAIERYTRKILLQHNIKSYSGQYFADSIRWECDIVIETTDVIIIIEVKKKALTQRARAGEDVSVVLDLAQSLLDAQRQAGNHELQLIKNGYLDLDDNGEITRIHHNERKIERIALSFTDFGSFHDRMFLEKFLTAVTSVRFTANDAKYEKRFNDLNQTITSLQEQNSLLLNQNDNNRRPYFDCWFFSLPQLMIILDGVNEAEGFREALWSLKGICNGHGDLYFDVRHVESIKINKPDMYAMMRNMVNSGKTFLTN